jgi:hypothetical protein
MDKKSRKSTWHWRWGMSKERELLMRWLAGEANQIPTHVPLLIETQNLLAQPEALAPEREFIRLWYENIELWKVHAKEPEHSEKGLKENISQMAVEIYKEGFEDGIRFAENAQQPEQDPVAWMEGEGKWLNVDYLMSKEVCDETK